MLSREQLTTQYLELWRNKRSLDDKNNYYGKPKWNWEEQERRADVWGKQWDCQIEAARRIRIQTNMAYFSANQPSSANRTSVAQSPSAGSPGKTASHRSEAEAVLLKVLRAAQLDTAMLANSPESYEEEFGHMDAIWTDSGILGWLRVISEAWAKSPEEVADWVDEGVTSGCNKQSGQYSKKIVKTPTMLRLTTFCALTDGTRDENYYIVVPRSSGGYYLFATMPTNDPSTFQRSGLADEKIAGAVGIIADAHK
ncbi:MAG: hypothetical protein C5B53_03135 [Candidatus Melainabacteria bacterium]|nr:MAG: hypothetical protein C5B53_03135 [Candidatus Melainabacteria bacterium]